MSADRACPPIPAPTGGTARSAFLGTLDSHAPLADESAMGNRHAIAAGHHLSAEAGMAMLEDGGSAGDAAVAAALAAMVAEPVLAGLLGGGFAMVRGADGTTRLLDSFVDTPGRGRPAGEVDFRAIEADFGETRQEFHIGAGSIAASGLSAGLWELHARLGRMPMAEVAAPAISAARAGVGVTAYQALLSRIVAPILTASTHARALHCDGEGALLGEGAVRRNPDLADVLEVYAAEGPRFVQEGEVAAGLLALCESGGHLAAPDLARHTPRWRTPLAAARGRARIALNPPPSLGGALIRFALTLAPMGADPAEIAAALAATVRARGESGIDADPEAGAAHLARPDIEARQRDGLARPAATRGTTQISVVDADGTGVALTLSNGEGCGLIVPRTGIMPNNMLGEADLLPGGFGSWTPGVRLASMMAPLAVDWPDGRFAMLGSGGSNRIRSALMQVLLALIDREATLEDAILAPRLHVEDAEGAALDYEEAGFGHAARDALRAAWPAARGWAERSMFFGGAHGVVRNARGGVDACGDPRRAGHALTD